CLDPHFGFSRYAERLGRSASDFEELQKELGKPLTLIDEILHELLRKHMNNVQPSVVLVSVPFPGNLYSAFRTASLIKKEYPKVKIAMGGGYPNTELRSIAEAKVFDYFDIITLDDGERPIKQLLEFVDGRITKADLKRTFLR